MQSPILSTIILASVWIMAGPQQSRADYLTVLNPGFESPGYRYAPPADWTASASFLEYSNNLNGQLLPPPGTDIGSYSGFASGPGEASQIIDNYSIAANSIYTLNVLVGGRADSSGFGFGGSTIELFDATTSNVLAEYTLDRGTGASPLDGFFESQTVAFSTGLNGGPIGDQLGIELEGLGEGPQTWFDNVSAEVSPSSVPEPSSIGLMVMGIAGMAAYGWRRRKPATI